MTFITVDPGLDGAVVVFRRTPTSLLILERFVMPTKTRVVATRRRGKATKVKRRSIDAQEIVARLRQYRPDFALMEKVTAMPGQGVTSMFSFGENFGLLKGILASVCRDVRLVRPQAWQIWVRKQYGEKAEGKEAWIEIARQEFGEDSVLAPGRRKPQDGLGDALCMALYACAQGEMASDQYADAESA